MAKIAVISDSPLITSGFGVANRPIIDAMLARGHDVEILGVLDTRSHFNAPYKVWPVYPQDPLGMHKTAEFLQTYQPDLIFLHGDPGTLYGRMTTLRFFVQGVPVVALFPIEGAPVHDAFVELTRHINLGFCYTRAGAQLIEDAGGVRPRVQYLGYDHTVFRPVAEDVRQRLRYLVGFDTSFVVSNHSFNKRGNRQPAYIRAASRMQDTNLLMYLHTNPLEGDNLQGWNLEITRHQYGAANVLFRPERTSTYEGIAFTDDTPDEHWFQIERPASPEGRAALFASLPIRLRYALADLYIDASSVQGFNLPTVEAAACGVPVISTDDGIARTELFGDLALHMFQPDSVDYWHSGAELALVSPEQIERVLRYYMEKSKRNPEFLPRMRERSIERVQRFTWNVTPLMEGIEAQLTRQPTAPGLQRIL